MRLVYKTFLAFLLTAILAVAMIGTLQVYLSHRFADYLSQAALESLDDLVDQLADDYRSQKGWTLLRNEPDRWRDLLRRLASRKGAHETHGPPAGEGPVVPAPPPPRDGKGWDWGGAEPPSEAPRPPVPIRRVLKGLVLFDADLRPVAGNPVDHDPDGYAMREIRVNGALVGWLGLPKRERPRNPTEAAFHKAQSQAFYLVGAGILLLVGFVSFLFSKHILKPIRQLADGTRSLTGFHFDARIAVNTRDELGQLAQDFNRMAETLSRYEEMRRQWVSDISHELRTPLAVLRGEIEALQDGIRAPNRATLDSLHSEIVRLGKMVDDLHTLSLADSRDLRQRNDWVEPLEILKESAATFRTRLERKGIGLQLDIDASRPFAIRGDADRLAQLFANLFENTLRYTDAPGGLAIKVRVENDRLIILFADSAPGVPEESLPRLFDRLYRVDPSRSRELGGSGLGLAICRQIVLAHGGTISAEHSPAGGVCIRITLPPCVERPARRV